MTAASNAFTPQEFLEKLGTHELDGDSPLTLTGMVKPNDESSTELMFVVGTRCSKWTSVPIDIIDNIAVLGSVPCDEHSHPRVKLTFKTPQSPEATAYASLLRAGGTQQGSGRRVVRKPKGGGSTAQSGSAQFLDGGCGCSDLEIDLDGTVWELTTVEDHGDYCICTYQHG